MLGRKKQPPSGSIAVHVTIDPTSGDPSNQEVEVAMTGATLGDVLKAAGIKPDKKDLFLNGKPATLETHVTDGQKVTAQSPKPEVRVAERPRGS